METVADAAQRGKGDLLRGGPAAADGERKKQKFQFGREILLFQVVGKYDIVFRRKIQPGKRGDGVFIQGEEGGVFVDLSFQIEEIPQFLPCPGKLFCVVFQDVFMPVGQMEHPFAFRKKNFLVHGHFPEKILHPQKAEHVSEGSGKGGGEVEPRIQRAGIPEESRHASAGEGGFFQHADSGALPGEQQGKRHAGNPASHDENIKIPLLCGTQMYSPPLTPSTCPVM